MESLKNPEVYMPGESIVADIKSHIGDYNRERPAIYQSCTTMAYLSMGAYAVVAVLLTIYALQIDDRGKLSGLIIGLVGVAGFWLWGYVWRPIKDHQLGLRYRLFPKVFAFIDDVRYSAQQEPYFLETLKQLKIVNFTSTENDDLISGRHDGMEFQLVETQLILGSGKHKQTVFKGLIFHFKLEKEFPGMLVAAKRGSWWQRTMREMWRTAASDELASGNRQLDETHEFHSDNFGAAKPIIRGPLTSLLIWLGNEWHGGDVQIALSHENGYLMLPSKRDFFALPEMQSDVHYESDVKPLVRELVMLLAVAHVVRKVG